MQPTVDVFSSRDLQRKAGKLIQEDQVVPDDSVAAVADTVKASECRGDTILLVEDEPTLRTLYKLFVDNLGYHALVAENSKEALVLASRHPGDIHLLMTDVVMPEMNGPQLAEQLRARRPQTKVLFMSGYTADVMAAHGVLEKDAAFIAKPFSFGELARKLQETLDAVSR